MRAVLALSILASLTACAADDDTDLPGPDVPGPACPAPNLEVCLVHDGAWSVDCEYGNVTLRDDSYVGYCSPGKHELLCESTPKGPQILMACDSGCSDEVKLFDTYAEYQQFEPSSLCL